ncbi:tRNA (N(6)-L-threonylcarbamoyladenosine(37)-C(2))-methylthiotransferase [Candidatus Woesearchaeota archaeon]|nr:tRNA (N(6)-L-threonylcarbamoyladenosine(37)-C(2))-methylthiotransferase [Candidatus Woesearchaeota archaeon]
MPIKIFIKTYGCSHNVSDSEVMAGLLKQADFQITEREDDANLILINSCTVKNKSQNHFFKYLEEVKKQRKPVVVAGCIPQTMPDKLSGLPMVGTKQVSQVVSVVEEALNDNPITALAMEPHIRLNLPKIRSNPIVEIIPIQDGCLSACTFCLTKKARGSLRSFMPEDIVKQAKTAVQEGVKEIWLSSEDNGCYGFDIKTNLAKLVKEIVKIPGDFKVRVGMGNPQHFMKYLEELVEILKHEKVYKFIHIPVQSGSNKVLKEMKRGYTVEEFKELVAKLRKAIPEITIATDVIVAFPGETHDEFLETVQLLKDVKPPIVNISRYSDRPGTAAAQREDQISGDESKQRSSFVTQTFEYVAYEQNKKWQNWEGEVVVTQEGKDHSWVGRNYCYKPVILHGKFTLGDKVKVKVMYSTIYDLRADIMD